MIWREHSTIRGQHAFLSPSQFHWINYTQEKLKELLPNEDEMKKLM